MLYEEAVQAVDEDLDFFVRVYHRRRGKPFRRLREDFCGTALLASRWVRRSVHHRAWGIDLDPETLAWGNRHHLAYLGAARRRLRLIQGNVLTTRTPLADVVVAFNFSCFVFKERKVLLKYFKRVRDSLADSGMFFLDVFGGKDSMGHKTDRRKVGKHTREDGLRLPRFTYLWQQEQFNAIDHHIRCHIHFRFADGSRIQRAFSYDWRLWTLPELQDLLGEAGFRAVHVYLHGWTKDGESDEVYRRRTFFENELAWVGYIVALK